MPASCITSSFQRPQYRRGGKSKFAVEKYTNSIQSQELKVTITRDAATWWPDTGNDVMSTALHLWDRPHQEPSNHSHHEKLSKQTATDGPSTKRLARNPKNDQGHQKQWKPGTSLVVQWLRFLAPNARGPGSILVSEPDPAHHNQDPGQPNKHIIKKKKSQRNYDIYKSLRTLYD